MLVFLLVCLLGSCIARLSPRVMVASPAVLFASRPSDRPSLLCLFVRRLSGTSPSLVRVVDPSLVFLLESSLSYRCLVARPLGSTRLHWALCSLRFGCSVLHSARHGCSVLHSARHCSIRLALRAFLFYLLVEFGRHAVHTHSVPRVVSRHSVITHSLFHSCSPSSVVGFVASRLVCHACFVMKGVSTWVENGT